MGFAAGRHVLLGKEIFVFPKSMIFTGQRSSFFFLFSWVLVRQSLTKYLLSFFDIPTTNVEITLAIFPHLPLSLIPHHVLTFYNIFFLPFFSNSPVFLSLTPK